MIRNTSIHAGIRAPLIRPKKDIKNDRRCGFEIVTARDIDRIGVSGTIERLINRVGDSKVYISVDIDVLDPAFAPGENTPFFEDATSGSLYLDGSRSSVVVSDCCTPSASLYQH